LTAKILEQAAVVFAEQGYRNATTEDIAKRVKLKKSSLYHYFKNKENILFQALATSLRRSLEPLQALAEGEGDSRERLRKAVALQVHTMMSSPYVANLFLNERSSLHPRHLKQCLELRNSHEVALRSIVDQGIADGSFAGPLDSNIVVRLIFGVLNGLPWWWKPTGKYALDQIADMYANLLVDRMLTSASAHRRHAKVPPPSGRSARKRA